MAHYGALGIGYLSPSRAVVVVRGSPVSGDGLAPRSEAPDHRDGVRRDRRAALARSCSRKP